MDPIALAANPPRRYYRGGGRIARFRGGDYPDDLFHPEDWVAATTASRGLPNAAGVAGDAAGLTVLPDGQRLVDAVAADPEGWLGPAHLARFGPDPALLVKLLDAGERLPLHVHPDRRFARTHLASGYGKTEAWVVVEAVPDAVVHLGFSRDVTTAELRAWVAGQQVADMLAATNQVPVRAGDAVFCPAGLPHAIGEGIFLVELQEPTDLSVLLEWANRPGIEPDLAYLGLALDQALACVDRAAWSRRRIDDLFRARRAGRPGVRPLLPAAADPFFAAERLRPDPVAVLDPGFSVLVVTGGEGVLATGAGARLPVRRGATVLVPHAAGVCQLRRVDGGAVAAVRCRPPDPAA